MPNNETAKTKSAPKKRNLLIGVGILLLLIGVGEAFFTQRAVRKTSDEQCAIEITDPDAPRPDVVGYEPPKVCIELERAVTEESQRVGLSKYDSYDDKKGMIFENAMPGKACMWMKGMKFPIDIVWLDENKTIVDIEVDVDPSTYPESFCSEKPAKYVIELNQFVSEYAYLKVGQQLAL